VKIVAIAVSVILLMSIQAPVFALTQASPIVIIETPYGQQVSTGILPQIPGYNLSFRYRDTEFEAKAKQDMSLIYLYSPNNESKEPITVGIEIASTRSALHRWEGCILKYAPPTGGAIQIDLRDIQLTQNPPIISRYFVFQYQLTNETQAILYWYEYSTFTVNSTLQQKNVKISLIAFPENQEDLSSIENQLVAIGTEIANYWQPIKAWSQITMIISQNGANLALATTAILIAIIGYYVLETRRQIKANRNVYQKLSKLNRQIIDIVKQTEKTALPTLENMATTYQKTIGKQIKEKQLLNKLNGLEKTGIIKSIITSRQDEPVQIWRTQITF
jgi:hypothetical protein